MEKETTIGHKSTNEFNIGTSKLVSGIRMPYLVDDTYFDHFSQSMTELVSSFNDIKQPDFAVPEKYFDELAISILSRVKEESSSINSSEPIINNKLFKQNLYSIPEGYFDNISVSVSEIILQTDSKTTSKIVSIDKYKKWSNIAIAASLIGLVITSAILFSSKSNSTERYLSYKSVDVKSSVNKLSDDDLVKYLNTDVEAASVDMTIIDDGAEPDVDQRIKAVSDFDLDQYLQESATTNVKKGI